MLIIKRKERKEDYYESDKKVDSERYNYNGITLGVVDPYSTYRQYGVHGKRFREHGAVGWFYHAIVRASLFPYGQPGT